MTDELRRSLCHFDHEGIAKIASGAIEDPA
jgi:hypothetical protein